MKRLLIPIMLLVLSTAVLAQVSDYREKYVNDFANVLNATQQNALRALFSNVDQATTAEMTLLTVDTVYPMAMSQYAQEVFDKWKIGKAETDNGLLILYAEQENKIWVSVGYGLEGILPDSKIGRILDETFVPARVANNTAEGIMLAALEYANVINENADEVRAGRTADMSELYFVFIWFAFMAAIIILQIRWYANPKCQFCGGKTKKIGAETTFEETPSIFGKMKVRCAVESYKCEKCGKITKRKRKRESRVGGFIVYSGGNGGGGFGGGGFGGGGGGGGGAGR